MSSMKSSTTLHPAPLLPTVLGGVALIMVVTQALSWTAFTDVLYTYQIGPEVIIPALGLSLIGLELIAAGVAWPGLARTWRRRSLGVLLLVWLIWSSLVVGALSRGIVLGNLGFFGSLPPIPAFVGMLFIPILFLAVTIIALVQMRRPLT